MARLRCARHALRMLSPGVVPLSASRTSGREGFVEISTNDSRDQTICNLNGFCDRRIECHSCSTNFASSLDVARLKQLSHFVDQFFVRERLADVAVGSRWKRSAGSRSGSF